MKKTIQALLAVLILALPVLGFAAPAAGRHPGGPAPASGEAARPPAPAIPGDTLLKVQPGGALARRLADKLLGAREIGRLDALGVARLNIGPDVGTDLAVRLYESLPFVGHAGPDYILHAMGLPNDPMYAAHQRWYYDLIEAPAAWEMEPGAQPAVVAVLDTGVDITHPDLRGKIWVNQGEIPGNGVDDDGNGCVDDVHGCNLVEPGTADPACVGRPPGPSNDVTDNDGHGTFVAGVVGATRNNGQGVVGTTDSVVLMPVKVLACTGGGTMADVAAGIIYAAENGAQVINMSFGSHLESEIIRRAIKTAHDDYGVVLVASTGNDGARRIGFPAFLEEVIAVGATDHKKPDERVPFSNWGPELDVVAPGVRITSTVPSKLCSRNWKCISSLPYSQADGTSFAAPLVSGLAGLLLSRDPGLSNEDVRAIIKSTADPLTEQNDPGRVGAGRIRMKRALEFDPEELPAGGLSPGCNLVTLTFADGTEAAALADAVSPAGALQTVWRLDNATGTFAAFVAAVPQASDLASLNLLDAVFVCVDAAATIAMPAVSPDPSGATFFIGLAARCNTVGLTFPDGTEPSALTTAVSPPGALQTVWRLDNATGTFQAYVAAAPEASDLTSLQFLDAVFICTGEPATLEMPAVIAEG